MEVVDGEIDETVLNLETEHQIQPYCFEPEPQEKNGRQEENSDSEEEEEQEDEDSQRPPGYLPVDQWCSCGNCEDMGDVDKNKCCQTYQKIKEVPELGCCIITHPGFEGNCLNKYVLETSIYEFVHIDGRRGDDEPVHRLMRYIAYRRFTRWIFGILGKNKRKILPSCVTIRIREQFPSGFYMGFRHTVY